MRTEVPAQRGQLRRLAVDDLAVSFFGQIEVAALFDLGQLALADDVRRAADAAATVGRGEAEPSLQVAQVRQVVG